MLMSEVQEFILDMWIWNIDQKSYLYAKKKTHGYRLNLYKSELGNVYFGDFSIWSLKLWTWVRSLCVWVQTEENRRCSNKKKTTWWFSYEVLVWTIVPGSDRAVNRSGGEHSDTWTFACNKFDFFLKRLHQIYNKIWKCT